MALAQPTPLFTRETIETRVAELARRISSDYAGTGELLLVGVLKGAFIFLADLARRLEVPHRVDFVALSSYGAAGSTQGNLRLIMDLKTPVSGQHVLLVDDIVDNGSTLRFLHGLLAAHGPASVKSCVLVRKAKPRVAEVAPDYVGFEIPDVWVVGYGLDYGDRYRTLPYIAVFEPGQSA